MNGELNTLRRSQVNYENQVTSLQNEVTDLKEYLITVFLFKLVFLVFNELYFYLLRLRIKALNDTVDEQSRQYNTLLNQCEAEKKSLVNHKLHLEKYCMKKFLIFFVSCAIKNFIRI